MCNAQRDACLRVRSIDAAKGGVIKASRALLQDCEPLVLTHPASGDEFSFAGVQGVLSVAVEPADAFSPLTAVGTGPTRTAHSCSGMKHRHCAKLSNVTCIVRCMALPLVGFRLKGPGGEVILA